jgi:hypothetical protein
MKRTRRNHEATFKAHVTLAAVKGDKTLAELVEQLRVHPTQITGGNEKGGGSLFSSKYHRPSINLCLDGWLDDLPLRLSNEGL